MSSRKGGMMEWAQQPRECAQTIPRGAQVCCSRVSLTHWTLSVITGRPPVMPTREWACSCGMRVPL